MLGRTSSVHRIYIRSASLASVLQIGDSTAIQAVNRALAIQREKQLFIGDEEDFSKYAFFQRPIPLPPFEEDEQVVMTTRPLAPLIRVGYLDVQAFSSSSILHVGTTNTVQLEARIKHIRQLLRERPTNARKT